MLASFTCYGQLSIRPFGTSNSDEGNSQARSLATRDTINLPFWDDFSFTTITPDTSLWESNTGVFVNGTLGKQAPTINVASFDGVDLSGNPHNPDGVTSITTDVLVSQPIDLEAVASDKQDSVYLSFYWQMEGFGEVPEQKDSLKLDFLNNIGEWNNEFFLLGEAENQSDAFTKHEIKIDREEYFHSGFQFKFTAVGNSTGPFDAWHIDYVYLNQDRAIENESLVDRAVADPPTSIFSQYTNIPYDILFEFPDTIYQDISFEFLTLENKVHPVEFEYTLTNYDYPNTDSAAINATLLYINDVDDNFSIPRFGRNTNSIPALNSSYFTGFDSLFIEAELIFSSTSDGYFVKSVDGVGSEEERTKTFYIDEDYNYRLNDTVRTYFEIHETLAYDDGQAEYAAGLNKTDAQIAVYFNIPSEDTLTHIDIYFPQINPSSAGKRIFLYVLSDLSGEPRSVRRVEEFIIPGDAQLNEYDRFEFEFPVIVSGEFYIALQQFTNDYIGIGLDNNNLLGLQKIWVNTEDSWSPNLKVEGIIMMRPVFADSDFVVADAAIDEPSQINIYPNPVNQTLHIEGNIESFEVFDPSGRMIYSGQSNSLSTASFLDGIYLLKVRARESTQVHKIIVRH
ncbi:MAG: T9SS type A sorting domain-containing protein [Reichenbachiella sp.]|uniref:T9SS type A sorting domain-containing protein n=1 Tax=Reichenbachiella sp. TaxID=2184521 RepID=UPI00326790B2